MIGLYDYDTATKDECLEDLNEVIDNLYADSYDWFEYADLDVLERRAERIQNIVERLRELENDEETLGSKL